MPSTDLGFVCVCSGASISNLKDQGTSRDSKTLGEQVSQDGFLDHGGGGGGAGGEGEGILLGPKALAALQRSNERGAPAPAPAIAGATKKKDLLQGLDSDDDSD